MRAGKGRASGRIARDTPIRVADAILTGVRQPAESPYELLRAYAADGLLARVSAEADERGYRGNEFGDSWLIERQGVAG